VVLAALVVSAAAATASFLSPPPPPASSSNNKAANPPSSCCRPSTRRRLPLLLHAAAANKAANKATPAQRVQIAVEPEAILQVVTEERLRLKPSHLAVALFRIAKALVPVRHQQRRQRLVASTEFKALVQEALAGASRVRHIHDALLGIALAEFPLMAHPDVRGTVERLFAELGEGESFRELQPGDLSGLAWSWEKLGLDAGALPAAFQAKLTTFPFRVRIGALGKGGGKQDFLDLEAIVEEVALRRDSILIGSKSIEESRLTAWQGPCPFYYSNKTMSASPMTSRIAAIRDRLADETGVFYDCVLINLYENGEVGMRYHSDPDQGLYWSTTTAVVSIGDTREFCLRDVASKGKIEHHRFFVSQACVVEMVDDCQIRYQHCVKQAGEAGPRVSLVFKQSLEQ
jgi:alkylated DNA repair dioxygenase AlkB